MVMVSQIPSMRMMTETALSTQMTHSRLTLVKTQIQMEMGLEITQTLMMITIVGLTPMRVLVVPIP